MTDASAARALAGPWRAPQVRIVALAQAVAVVVVVVAAVGSARTGSFDEQTDWVVLGITGLAFAVVVSAAWIQLGRRTLVRRRTRVARSVAAVFDRPAATGGADLTPVATSQMSHYHRESCQLVLGKDAVRASVIEHHRAKRTPCAVCRP